MDKKLPPAEEYGISFYTTKHPGFFTKILVSLREDVVDMSNKDEMKNSVRLDLVDHPLYPELERYVLANKSNKGTFK